MEFLAGSSPWKPPTEPCTLVDVLKCPSRPMWNEILGFEYTEELIGATVVFITVQK